jgi:hypothetical protein
VNLNDDHGRGAARRAERALAVRAVHARTDVRRRQRAVRCLYPQARLVHALAIDHGEQAVLTGGAQPESHLVRSVAIVRHLTLHLKLSL